MRTQAFILTIMIEMAMSVLQCSVSAINNVVYSSQGSFVVGFLTPAIVSSTTMSVSSSWSSDSKRAIIVPLGTPKTTCQLNVSLMIIYSLEHSSNTMRRHRHICNLYSSSVSLHILCNYMPEYPEPHINCSCGIYWALGSKWHYSLRFLFIPFDYKYTICKIKKIGYRIPYQHNWRHSRYRIMELLWPQIQLVKQEYNSL